MSNNKVVTCAIVLRGKIPAIKEILTFIDGYEGIRLITKRFSVGELWITTVKPEELRRVFVPEASKGRSMEEYGEENGSGEAW